MGLSKGEILQGANINSIVTGQGSDTEADQRALSNGIDFKGVQWEK